MINTWMRLGEAASKWAHLTEDGHHGTRYSIKTGVGALVGKVRPRMVVHDADEAHGNEAVKRSLLNEIVRDGTMRTKVTKGPGSRAAGIAMVYMLIDAARARWRAVDSPHLVALVRAGAVFHQANYSSDRHHTR